MKEIDVREMLNLASTIQVRVENMTYPKQALKQRRLRNKRYGGLRWTIHT